MKPHTSTRQRVTFVLGSFLLAVLLASCGGSGAASGDQLDQIKKAGVIKAEMAPDPPFTLRTSDGRWYGFSATFFRMAARALGVRAQFVPSGASAEVAGLQAGKYDLIGSALTATAERAKAIAFTVPYTFGGNTWIVRKSDASRFPTLKALNSPSATIAFIASTSQDQFSRKLMPKAKFRALPDATYAQLLTEVQSGRADATAVPSFLAPAIVAKFTWSAALPNANPRGVAPVGVVWGIPKNQPHLKAALDKFITARLRDGTVKRLLRKYVTVKNSLAG